MGYTTEFTGHFTISPPLEPEQVRYLQTLSETRRMRRNEFSVAKLPDAVRKAVGLPVGQDGQFYVGSTANFGQSQTSDVVDYNEPPRGQPGLRLQWVPSDDGGSLEWNGSEKFYYYVEWLDYIAANFLIPWGRKLDGIVRYQGEEADDFGEIRAHSNVIVKVTGERRVGPLY